jgi:hypothetical protein
MSSQPTRQEGQPSAANRAELATLEQRRAKTRALKQGMMQELLTGMPRLG